MDNLPPLNAVDLAILGLIALGAIRGYFRGLSGELGSLVGLVAAFAAGIVFDQPFADWIARVTRLTGPAAFALSYTLIVAAAMTVMVVIANLMKRLIQIVVARQLDRNLGLVAGAAKTTVFAAIVMLALQLWPVDALQRHVLTESAIGTLLQRAMPGLRHALEDSGLPVPPPERGPSVPGDAGDDAQPEPPPARPRNARESKGEQV